MPDIKNEIFQLDHNKGLLEQLSGRDQGFRMVLDFVALADSGSLAAAGQIRGCHAESISAGIQTLEGILGHKLFLRSKRGHNLTKQGALFRSGAAPLIQHFYEWLQGRRAYVDGLPRQRIDDPSQKDYIQQQLPISKIWSLTSGLLAQSLESWAKSKGIFYASEFDEIRPAALAYKLIGDQWVLVHAGENSTYVRWVGAQSALSIVGMPLSKFPFGSNVTHVLTSALVDVANSESPRLDQVYVKLIRPTDMQEKPLCFLRLILPSFLDDGTRVMLSVVSLADRMYIDGLSKKLLKGIPADLRDDAQWFSADA